METESHADWSSFMQLRAKLFSCIQRALEEDDYSKSYEGTFELIMPSYFEESYDHPEDDAWILRLHCYVIGPNRHYEWQGRTMTEVVAKAKESIDQWCEAWK